MKMSQSSRFYLSGLAAIVIMISLALQPQHAFSQFASPLPTPTATSSDVIDLAVDVDHDGMPDQLKAAIQDFETVYTEVSKQGDLHNNPAALDALQKAHDKLSRRLPYRGQTRAAQARLTAIYEALSKAPAAAARDKLWAEAQTLQAQMQEDPNFALVDQIVSRRLLDALNAKIEAGRAAQPSPAPAMPIPSNVQSAASASPSTEADDAPVQAASANGGGQTLVPISWNEIFAREQCNGTQAPNFNSLTTRGRILFYGADNKMNNFFYAKKWSHIGMYNGVTDTQRVYEANTEDGVRLRPIQGNWTLTGACVGFSYVNGPTLQQQQNALDWAQGFYGTDGHILYNYNFVDKNTDSAIYCSQLIWKIFMHIGKDLDSNSLVYATWLDTRFILILGGVPANVAANYMVAPDEIALHPDVVIYFEGAN